MCSRRSLLVNGILVLMGASAAAASIPLDAPSRGPDCVDCRAIPGQPGYFANQHAFHWSIYLDGRLLAMDGSDGLYVIGADQRAGYVDVYLLDAAGYPAHNGDITRLYGRVRIIQGERFDT